MSDTRSPSPQPAATPAPYVRPQQPADSSAASLPTETLKHIFDAGLTSCTSPEQKQSFRIVFGQVAAHWRSLADINKQAVVNSRQAGKLAEVINDSETLKGQLKYLIVKFEPSNPGRGQRVAELLKATPKLETLVLHLQPKDQLGRAAEYGQLGKPMYEALKKLPELVEIFLKEELQLAPNLLCR